MNPGSNNTELNFSQLAKDIKQWSNELGFQACGITHTRLEQDEAHLQQWLQAGMHGDMDYMQRHGTKRTQPEQLIPGTISIISVRMDYMPPDARHPETVLGEPDKGYISRYAMGRDYHKVMRNKLQKLAGKIQEVSGPFNYRAFVDSAPVLEKALARNAGLGWIGKHTNLINPKAGSWFFIGEIYTDLPLAGDQPFTENHCGSCSACIDICPTEAIIGPYRLDARKCISYLTIELKGSIPEQFRKPMGNRIYGCDDCQLICPWNKFARNTEEQDFRTRHGLDDPELCKLFLWTESEFKTKTEGSAIRRIGFESWLRNLAVALGNANSSPTVIHALQSRIDHPSEIVKEHVKWALNQHEKQNNEL